MTYHDWRIVNNFFREIRTGDWADRKTVPGIPIPQSRYFRIFPEAINRSMMIHEFGLAKQLGLYLKKDGEYRKGVIALPTQMAQSALNIMNHSVEQTVRFSDNEIIKFRNLIDPYIEGIPEGQALWEVALGEREDAVGKWLTDFLAEKEPQKKAELYADAQEYFKRANQTRKKHDWNTLRAKQFRFVAVDPVTGKKVDKKITGEQYIKEINDILTRQMEHMYNWMNGSEEFRKQPKL